jgi:hypothetical protein
MIDPCDTATGAREQLAKFELDALTWVGTIELRGRGGIWQSHRLSAAGRTG